jgi:hypothetical protein
MKTKVKSRLISKEIKLILQPGHQAAKEQFQTKTTYSTALKQVKVVVVSTIMKRG